MTAELQEPMSGAGKALHKLTQVTQMRRKKFKNFPFVTVPIKRAPQYLQFNPYITDGYRVKLNTYQCFLSMFSWSNETVNIWTHSIGFFMFVGVFLYDFVVVYGKHKASSLDAGMASFVLLCFMVCMIFSTLYHTFNCHSLHYCRLWLAWDIFGISTAFLAIFVSGIYYGFWCDKHITLRYTYIGFVCLLFATAMAFLLVPRLTGDEWSWARITLFTLWSLSGLFPTLHWITLYGGTDAEIVQLFLPRIFYMYAISGTALIIYIFKIPESFMPGKFNYVGASHQLWHIIIIIALLHWHQSGLMYAKYREEHGCVF